METSPQQPGPRIALWIAGLVLWIAALGASYFAWQAWSAAADAQRESERRAAATVVVDDEAGRAKPGALRSAWDERVAEFSLTERSGRTVTDRDLRGKPWIVNFIFTRCSQTCPLLTSAMARLQKKLKDVDVRLVTITVDPRHDTTKVLSKYAELFAADEEKWLFLTGEQDEIHRLINESFLLAAAPNPEPVSGFEFAHSNSILLVDAQGKVVDKFLGTDEADMARLVGASKKLASEQTEKTAPTAGAVGEADPAETEAAGAKDE